MGGHGGLNILPQKRWNVYNFDNREKVRKDEEAAAREESIRQQQQREKDSEDRLAKLRDAALAKHRDGAQNAEEALNNDGESTHESQVDEIQKVKLFNGLISFKRLAPGSVASETYKGPQEVDKKIFRGDKELERLYKRATKEATRVGKDGVEADDEHYRLGYGCLDRTRKRPWYLLKSLMQEETGAVTGTNVDHSVKPQKKQKKTIEELRQERLKREQQERERAQKIVSAHCKGDRNRLTEGGRHPYYNSSFGNAR
ncbi:hypothetical protein GOP47_0024972 [Adiantum capillus-veneris]|uniref:CBF1-interacting co-repressor CIR N-terminal domain-containing protein n=1 Tax=Adiantum capillus-veneris TaxID=13818 RepID=A0A9D4U3T0_ADICA|nr:hypothetical protein GOP47_0024972 [Adiantum capillus-veneris]